MSDPSASQPLVTMNVLQLGAASIPLLAFVFLNPWLPSWGSRKVDSMRPALLLLVRNSVLTCPTTLVL